MTNTQKVTTFLDTYFPKGSLIGLNVREKLQSILPPRLSQLADRPIELSEFNQMSQMLNENRVSDGFFRYYFLEKPGRNVHPYPVDRVLGGLEVTQCDGVIGTWEQFHAGIERIYIDGLLFFGNVRGGFNNLGKMSFDELVTFFKSRRFDSEAMKRRGKLHPFIDIAAGDRHLTSQFCQRIFASQNGGDSELMKHVLNCAKHVLESLPDEEKKIEIEKLRELGGVSSAEYSSDAYDAFNILIDDLDLDECMDKLLLGSQLILWASNISHRAKKAFDSGTINTKLFLGAANEMDVYVATSLTTPSHCKYVSRVCGNLFSESPDLRALKIRYFDPSICACSTHYDKGLLECLMVKCSKALLYVAGERDSFGKDVEFGLAMALGKPVIMLFPEGNEGKSRMLRWQSEHPLGRIVAFGNGAACGPVVTNSVDTVRDMFVRLFENRMEYTLQHVGLSPSGGKFSLTEKTTGSEVRIQTSNAEILGAYFHNYYNSDSNGFSVH